MLKGEPRWCFVGLNAADATSELLACNVCKFFRNLHRFMAALVPKNHKMNDLPFITLGISRKSKLGKDFALPPRPVNPTGTQNFLRKFLTCRHHEIGVDKSTLILLSTEYSH